MVVNTGILPFPKRTLTPGADAVPSPAKKRARVIRYLRDIEGEPRIILIPSLGRRGNNRVVGELARNIVSDHFRVPRLDGRIFGEYAIISSCAKSC